LELVKLFEEYELVSAVDFSPNDKYLIFIQKPTVTNNLKLVSLDDFKPKFLFHSTTHPSHSWPQIGFTSKEDVIFKLQKGLLDIYKIDSTENIESDEGVALDGKFASIQSVVAYDKAEINDEKIIETAIICGCIVV
jgi:hypothetical protein